MPQRIQLRRTKGWRKPDGAVVVARPSAWGNPFKVDEPGIPTAAEAVRRFREWLLPYRHGDGLEAYLVSEANLLAVQAELRGRDLACWCPLDQPCHADVLLELANID